MKERPIIFTGESVRAILAGRKTQTRRLFKMPPGSFGDITAEPYFDPTWGWRVNDFGDGWATNGHVRLRCPHGEPGDRLWVREKWAPTDHGVLYRADFTDADESHVCWRWHSPRYLAREHSRLALEVVAVRVERIQEITEEDARAEGAREFPGLPSTHPYGLDGRWSMLDPTSTDECLGTARLAFANAWNKINGKRAPWATNPWVWVVEFQRVGAP